MPFWSQATSEPRRAHRFLLNLPGLGGDDDSLAYQQYLCRTVVKPAYTLSEVEHKFMGNTYYYPGAVTWDPVTATIVNAVQPDGNEILMNALYNSGYLDPEQQSAYFGAGTNPVRLSTGPGTPNKEDALFALGDVIIRELDGNGFTIGKWELISPFITNAKFGDLDYGAEDLLNIDITFRYDYARYFPGNGEGDPALGAPAVSGDAPTSV